MKCGVGSFVCGSALCGVLPPLLPPLVVGVPGTPGVSLVEGVSAVVEVPGVRLVSGVTGVPGVTGVEGVTGVVVGGTNEYQLACSALTRGDPWPPVLSP